MEVHALFNRPVWWKVILLFVVFASILILGGCGRPPANEPAVESVARQYLALLRQGLYHQAYEMTAFPASDGGQRSYYMQVMEKTKMRDLLQSVSITGISVKGDEARVIISTRSATGEGYNGVQLLLYRNGRWQPVIYPILVPVKANALQATAYGKNWGARVTVFMKEDPENPNRQFYVAFSQVAYQGKEPVRGYAFKKEGSFLMKGRSETTDEPRRRFNGSFGSAVGGSLPFNLSFKQVEELIRQGKITIYWQEAGEQRDEIISFDKAIFNRVSIPEIF